MTTTTQAKFTSPSKREAVKKARALRASGEAAKVFQVTSTYCQPGRGLAVAIWYEVR